MKLLHDLSLDELKRELEVIVEKMPRFRAGQIFDWATAYACFDEMTNIPADLRETLKQHFIDNPVKIEKELISKDGTKKYLLSLPDGNVVEVNVELTSVFPYCSINSLTSFSVRPDCDLAHSSSSFSVI